MAAASTKTAAIAVGSGYLGSIAVLGELSCFLCKNWTGSRGEGRAWKEMVRITDDWEC